MRLDANLFNVGMCQSGVCREIVQLAECPFRKGKVSGLNPSLITFSYCLFKLLSLLLHLFYEFKLVTETQVAHIEKKF